MGVRRRYGAWMASVLVVSGCAGVAFEATQAHPSMSAPSSRTPTPAQPFGILQAFADYREAPTRPEVERILDARATVHLRPDRHLEGVFPGGFRYLRLVPTPPDGRPRLDTGTMAALTFSNLSARSRCLTVATLSERLVASGWIGAPQFSAERHDGLGGPSRDPVAFSRHDRHLQLQLYAAEDGCLTGYALLWNMDLSLLAQLMPKRLSGPTS